MSLTLKQANTICDKALEHARAKSNQNFFLTLASTAQGKFLPQQGAVLIRDASGAILGAAGISGASGDEDEECAAKGVEAAGLKADI